MQQKRLTAKRDISAGTVHALLKDAQTANSDHDSVVANKLSLCVGDPVILTFSMAQSSEFCNGTNDVVNASMFASGSELPIVLVQITYACLGHPC